MPKCAVLSLLWCPFSALSYERLVHILNTDHSDATLRGIKSAFEALLLKAIRHENTCLYFQQNFQLAVRDPMSLLPPATSSRPNAALCTP
ncbi:hypothetical protein V8C26DRAFT_214888 [Trichoderma gracile]